ncbi:MAG: DUF3754 domain-containing protein [Synergistaceae bacterium]|nr:DUF3754 domain-containing protein [Synergistota bacterium]NLM70754.1 DUF3754 domain-containing protein [Synergistaceae bacterium]
MAINPELDKFIPLRTDDLVDALCEESRTEADAEKFRRVAELVEATYHYDFHDTLKRARRAYHIFNPDADTLKFGLDNESHDLRFAKMVEALKELLLAANYREFPVEELNEIMTKAAPRGLNIKVNLDKYDEVLIFRRGSMFAPKPRTPLSWWSSLRGKKESVEPELEEVIQRLMILIRLKSSEDVEEFYETYVKTAAETEREREKRMAREAVQGKKPEKKAPADTDETPTIFLKAFKNVPVSTLQTLFPDITIQMTLVDKGKILLPLAAGILGVVNRVIPAILVIGTLVTAVVAGRAIDWAHFKEQLFPILAALVIVGTISFKVFSKYRITKDRHQAKLMKTLYFHNLDNNAGVFDFLVHEAEEEECKEALLAYWFLLTERNRNGTSFTEEELDDRIEEWLKDRFGVELDFEVDDALRKLEDKGLLTKEEGERLVVPSLDDTLFRLDELWDNIFTYSN